MYVYQIVCLLNGKSYIGITKNFEHRMAQHKGGYDKSSLIDQMIQLEGEKNFSYFIIDYANSYEEAYEKEKFYIKQKNTRFPNGYNQTDGGDCMLGTSNGMAKFSKDEIIEIRTRFNNDENYLSIYNDFKKVSLNQFLKILRNETYLDCEVLCKKRSLYNQEYLTKLKNNKLKFTEEEIRYFRNCWLQGINFKTIYKEYSEICSKDYFYQVYYGILYKNIMPEVFTPELKHLHSSLSHSAESNGRSKLTREKVLEARELYKTKKFSYSQLAKKYNVSPTTIRLAVIGKTWSTI